MDLTYYDILGVDEDASQDDIRRAYKQAAKKFHPDVDEGNDRQFRAIKTAYDVLGDPHRRLAYDGARNRPVLPPEPNSSSWGDEVDWGSESTWEAGEWPAESTASAPPWGPVPEFAEEPAPYATGSWADEQSSNQDGWDQQYRSMTDADFQRQSRRRANDRRVLVLGFTACATLLVPWIAGHSLVRDTWLHPRSSNVYDVSLRTASRYFLADWSAGSALTLGVAVVFVLVRPWSGRRGLIILAATMGLALLVGAVPYSRAQWSKAEASTASRLQNTVYPFASHHMTCGQASRSFGSSSVEPGKPEVTYTLYSAHYASDKKTSCDGLELWAGWRRVKQISLAEGQTIKAGDNGVSITGKPTIEKTVFTVKLASGKTLRYPLAQLLA